MHKSSASPSSEEIWALSNLEDLDARLDRVCKAMILPAWFGAPDMLLNEHLLTPEPIRCLRLADRLNHVRQPGLPSAGSNWRIRLRVKRRVTYTVGNVETGVCKVGKIYLVLLVLTRESGTLPFTYPTYISSNTHSRYLICQLSFVILTSYLPSK